MAAIFAIVTFLAVAVLLVLAVSATGDKGQHKVVQRRLQAIEQSQRRGNPSVELNLLRDELFSDMPALNKVLVHFKWSSRLREFLAQSGMDIKPGKFLLACAVAGLGSYLVVEQLYGIPLVSAAAALVLCMAPLAFVSFKRSRRLHEFERIFPEAIDLLARAVRAGHGFMAGLEMIGTEVSEPVAGEFRVTFDEQNFGLPLREALFNLAERVPLIDVRFFVTALLIQKETGGNLAEILDNLSRVIRERFKILGEVRVRTAQGRLTAAILIALPPAMAFLMRSVNPDYIKPLFTDPWGPYMLGLAAALQIVGAALLWKIVRIEV